MSAIRPHLVATLTVLAVLAAGRHGPVSPARAGSPQASAPQAPQPFRAGVNVVRVDVYPTRDGLVVPGLTAADFEVLEDGVPQRVDQCTFVGVRPAPPGTRVREPASVAASRQAAANASGRLFLLFLDTYHVSAEGSARVRTAVTRFLSRVLGPDDVVGVMTPEMSAADVTFTRRMDELQQMLERHWFWGRRDRTIDVEAEEAGYSWCYPDQSMSVECTAGGVRAVQPPNFYSGVAREMVERRREKKTLDAFEDLTRWVAGLRDERKAVLVISEGWRLFRPDESLTRRGPCDAAAVDETPRPGIRRLPGGRTGSPRASSSALVACERDRAVLASLDNAAAFRALVDRANRANVSFYPVDPRGLPVFDTSTADTKTSPEGVTQPLLTPGQAGQRIGVRLEALRGLAASTDGLAVVGSNDLDQGLGRIAADLTSYYLLAYVSTNSRLDGTFRKLSVRVRQPGVEVRARRGYLAPTAEEVAAATRAPDAPAEAAGRAAVTALAGAWAELEGVTSLAPVRTRLAWLAPGSGRDTRVWAVAERVRGSEAGPDGFAAGGEADAVLTGDGGRPLGDQRVVLPPGGRVAAFAFTVPAGDADALLLKVRLTPGDGGLAVSDAVRVRLASAAGDIGTPRLFRRGPAAARPWTPTADPRFSRTEHVRIVVPLAALPDAVDGAVVDRAGRALPLPVTCTTSPAAVPEPASAACDVALAPLAPGSYGLTARLTVGGRAQDVAVAFRIQ